MRYRIGCATASDALPALTSRSGRLSLQSDSALELIKRARDSPIANYPTNKDRGDASFWTPGVKLKRPSFTRFREQSDCSQYPIAKPVI